MNHASKKICTESDKHAQVYILSTRPFVVYKCLTLHCITLSSQKRFQKSVFDAPCMVYEQKIHYLFFRGKCPIFAEKCDNPLSFAKKQVFSVKMCVFVLKCDVLGIFAKQKVSPPWKEPNRKRPKSVHHGNSVPESVRTLSQKNRINSFPKKMGGRSNGLLRS